MWLRKNHYKNLHSKKPQYIFTTDLKKYGHHPLQNPNLVKDKKQI